MNFFWEVCIFPFSSNSVFSLNKCLSSLTYIILPWTYQWAERCSVVSSLQSYDFMSTQKLLQPPSTTKRQMHIAFLRENPAEMQECMTGPPYAPLSHSSFLPDLKYTSSLLYKPYAQGVLIRRHPAASVCRFQQMMPSVLAQNLDLHLGFCNVPASTKHNTLAGWPHVGTRVHIKFEDRTM